MFKIVLKSIWKNKLSMILIIIQISSMFYVVNTSIESFFVVDKQKKFLEETLGENKDLLIRIFIGGMPSKELGDNIKLLESELEQNKNIQYFGGLDAPTIDFDQLVNNESNKKMLEKNFSDSQRVESGASDTVIIDKNILNILNLEMENGELFSEEDFNLKDDEEIPIILGAEYDFLKIGDEITASNLFSKKIKFKVKGFLKANSTSIDVDGTYVRSIGSNLDTFILIPTFQSMENSSLHIVTKMDSYFIIADKKENISEIKNFINGELNKFGLEGSVMTFEEEFNEFANEYKKIKITSIFLISFLFIMSLFSIISVILFSIRKRRYNFGVLMTCGANKNYLKKIVVFEIALIIITSFLISNLTLMIDRIIYYINFLKIPFTYREIINLEYMPIILITAMIFTLIAIYLPLKKIGNMEACELMGGTE